MSFNISVPEELIQDVSDQDMIVSGHSQLLDVSCQHLDVSGGLQVDGHSQLVDVSCQHLDVSGGLQVDGHSQLLDVSCQHLDVSGNTTIGGTLDVDGDSQLANINCVSLTVSDTNEGIINGKDVNHAIHLRKDGNDEIALHEYGKITFYTGGLLANQTEKMRITSDGRVGIGTTSPGYPLEISVNNNTTSFYVNNYFNTGNQSGGATISDACLKANGSIVVTNAVGSSSDRRIKNNIRDISDSSALDTFRLLKPCIYEYNDVLKRGDREVYGFIAQEVASILPYSTHLINEKIPNIYKIADVSYNTLLFQSDNKYEYNISGELFRTLCVYDQLDKEIKLNIIDVSDRIITLTETLDISQVFVYGQEVDNFHILKKDAIWTISTAALQEVDRQLQEEKTKVSTLETQYNTLETQYNTLQSQYNDLLSRVSALENST